MALCVMDGLFFTPVGAARHYAHRQAASQNATLHACQHGHTHAEGDAPVPPVATPPSPRSLAGHLPRDAALPT